MKKSKRRAPSTTAERLQAGRRAMTVEDLHAMAAMGEDIDLDGLNACMAEAEALVAGYTRFRKHIREIDALLAQDPDNLPDTRPSSPTERRRKWQEAEQAATKAARSSFHLSLNPAERTPP